MRRWALLLAVVLAACDTPFEPRVEDGPAFALFGTLDGRSKVQSLRVQDLASSVFATPDQLAAAVTSTELTSGRTTVWRDSLVTLASGDRAHLFLADLAVAPGETHRIEAVRTSDGATSAATVSLPSPTVAARPPIQKTTAVQVDVAALSGRLDSPVVRYRVRRPDGLDDASFTAVAVPQGEGEAVTFTAFLQTAKTRAEAILYSGNMGETVLVDARLEGTVVSTEPAAVRNGAGGVAWAVPISIPIPFAVESLQQVGFIDGR